jgi:protein-tyrosine phosphatase
MKMPRLHTIGGALLATLLLAGCATTAAPPPRAANPPVQAPAAAPATDVARPREVDTARMVALQGAVNVRTFAGLRGRNGPIPGASFLRAADLARLTPADRDALAARGVVLDLDLRTAEELETAPDALASDHRFRYVRISLLGTEKLDLAKLPDDLGTMYVASLEANQPQFRQVFATLAAQPEGAVLFHCTAGKDRTGMVAALLLSLAGVPHADIVHDYAISAHYLAPMMRQSPQMAAMARQNPRIVALQGSPAPAIGAFLEALERRHGGAAAYLREIGVSEPELRRLMVRLGQAT